jgi:ribonuclease Z
MPRLCGIEIDGVSIGGIETCILLPELGLAFDLGRCPHEAVRIGTVLFTHAHMDHIMGGVAWHAATRALRRMPPPTYVVPPENEAALADLFAVWRRLDRSDLPHRLVALGPGEELALGQGRVARPFRSPHRVVCQGYGLWSRTDKLRPEHQGLPGAEIARLRRAGVAVTEVVERPELAFTGDTTIEVVEREAVVRTARVLIMEVTFLDERVSVAECRAKGHVHLAEVAERAALFENEAILFTHMSARYSAHEIVALLDRGLPAGLRARVTPLLAGHGPG